MKTLSKFALGALAPLGLVLAGTQSLAQIKNYTLDEIVHVSDSVLFGQITGQHVFRVDHPVDGPELYFTTITVEGTAVGDDTPVTVDITYNGGFVNAEEGVFNSEAPSADDVRIGNNVVVFYKWADNLGGDVRGNGLVAMHGGLYRTAASQKDSVILGRGPGYAVDRNIRLTDFDGAVRRIRDRK